MKDPIKLTEPQLMSFSNRLQSMGSLATLSLPGTYLQELKDCGVNERGTPRNELMGCIVTQPSGSQMAIETVFLDTKDSQHDGDLHVVNFTNKTLSNFYKGWGPWEEYYGKQHHADKSFFIAGTPELK